MTTETTGAARTPFTPERNKAIIREYIDECWNQRKFDKFPDYVAEDAVFHDLVRQDFPPGRAGAEENLRRFAATFPAMTMEMNEMLAEGDLVSYRFTSTARQEGEFQGFPPTHREATLHALVMLRMENGLIVEGWFEADQITLSKDLGIMPKGAPPRLLAWAMVARIRLSDRLARRRA